MLKDSAHGIWSIVIFLTMAVQLVAQPEGEINFDRIRVNPVDHPISFDLRTTGVLSAVKTQPTGGCWSSSVMATVEPWLRKTGQGDFHFSDRNLQLNHGFNSTRNTYGNHYMATAYFSRGAGPVEVGAGLDSASLLRPGVPFILSNARYLPGDPGLIKQTILDFGPVYTMLYFKRKAVDTVSYMLNGPANPGKAINHAVALVGWNDTLTTPAGPGAWIAQNSLGTKFGEEGFFYVPYANEDILKHNAVWNSWGFFDKSHRLLYYDTLGSFMSYGFNDSICYGLTRFTAEDDCRVVRLSSHINNPGTYLEFEIHSGFDEAGKLLTGKLGQTETVHCVFPGYYTLNLTDTVRFSGGTDFYVLARYHAPNAVQPLPVENVIENYSTPNLSEGKSWVNPNFEKWPEAWYECGRNTPYPSLEFDLCIRVLIEFEK